MDIEMEIKYKIENINVKKRLKELGAVKVRETRQVDIYLDHPCESFAEKDKALRIRIENGRAELTYKGPRRECEAKVREEINVGVSNPMLILTLLLRLGFKEVARVFKYREEYELEGIKVFVDTVKNLGKFIEIEFDEERKNKVEDLVKKLKLKKENEIKDTYLELLLTKRSL
ncbi:MAG TPA: class IV adenylate cyclase [Thermofilum sp.]|nr:class IV adenylate cyclase [Thermofilum sp.]